MNGSDFRMIIMNKCSLVLSKTKFFFLKSNIDLLER